MREAKERAKRLIQAGDRRAAIRSLLDDFAGYRDSKSGARMYPPGSIGHDLLVAAVSNLSLVTSDFIDSFK